MQNTLTIDRPYVRGFLEDARINLDAHHLADKIASKACRQHQRFPTASNDRQFEVACRLFVTAQTEANRSVRDLVNVGGLLLLGGVQ